MEASTLTPAASRVGILGKRSPLLKLAGDERLVVLIREHNPFAFDVLFERYHSRLLAFCRHMLRSTEDAEDVLQEVFVKAHAAMIADERAINVRPWLYRIARNRCLNHLRRPVPEGQDSMDVMMGENGVTTADTVQKREDFRNLVSDVQDLPETQRTALLLREIEALSYEDIALTMDTTIPAVKSLLVRARMSLAEATHSRQLTCGEVQLELAEAAEGLRKASGPVRHHVKRCEPCTEFRGQLRSNTKALAAIAPIGPIAMIWKALVAKFGWGGGSTAAGSGAGAGSGVAGGTAVAGGAGGAGVAGGISGMTAGASGLAGAGGAAAIGGGSGAALGGAAATGGIAGAIGVKAAATAATAALLTAGAVEVKKIYSATPANESVKTAAAQQAYSPAATRGEGAKIQGSIVTVDAQAETVTVTPNANAAAAQQPAEPAEVPAPADEPAAEEPAPSDAVPADEPTTTPTYIAEDAAVVGPPGGAGADDGTGASDSGGADDVLVTEPVGTTPAPSNPPPPAAPPAESTPPDAVLPPADPATPAPAPDAVPDAG
jgi:RNA polymerase sigma factor (sigma-70 family)